MYNESLQTLLTEFVEAQRVRRLSASTLEARGRALDRFFRHLVSAGIEDIRAVTRQHEGGARQPDGMAEKHEHRFKLRVSSPNGSPPRRRSAG